MSGVTEYINSNKDEKVDKVRNKFLSKTENDFWYVAKLNEQVVGVAILNKFNNTPKHAIGSITLMVDLDYQHRGIGKLLIEHLIKISFKDLGILKLELSVFEENIKAINLYKKYGFIEEGRIPKALYKDGKYITEVNMSKFKSQ